MDSNRVDRAGSRDTFDQNWRKRLEASYNHWTPAAPVNQIQLAFRQHWLLFEELIGAQAGGKCLEIGCGRGSISSYFASHNYDCTLMDISPSVLRIATGIFSTSGHSARFVCGDALQVPFQNDAFDVVVSIGLLEHFENVEAVLKEQVRIARGGGTVLCYIVPERPDNVQKYFNWLNKGLKALVFLFRGSSKAVAAKADIYRSSYSPEIYLKALQEEPVQDVQILGMYPLPMVSHSPEFPFTLLPKALEKALTAAFTLVLAVRKMLFKRNPWICSPSFGQAFLLVFRKVPISHGA